MNALKDHIKQFVKLSDADFETVSSFFRLQSLKRKDLLMEAGQLCRDQFFVLKGCLQLYYINEKGKEQTLQFAIENWWMTDVFAFQKQERTQFYIQAVETTEVLAISSEDLEQLLEQLPALERYFRMMYQIAYGASQQRLKYIHDFSKEESYFHFINHFPDFAQRVPQYLLASFLGFTPEYLSEIRKKKRF